MYNLSFWARHNALMMRSGTTEGGGGTPTPTPEPAAAPAAPVNDGGSGANGDRGIGSDIKAIMDFDPFGPGSEAAPGAQADDGKGAKPQTAAPPSVPSDGTPPSPTTPPVVPPAPVVPEPVAPPVASPAADLAEAARAMHEAAAALKAPPQAPAAPLPDEFAPRGDDDTPLDYRQINIPEPILQAMASENPGERRAATTQLLSSAMATAHRMAVSQSLRMIRSEMAQAFPTFVQRAIVQHQQQREVFEDFYKTFPDLSPPPIRNIIVEQAQILQKQKGNPGWTPAFRDALGEHVRAMLRGFVPAAAAPAAAPAPAAPGGVMTPPSARPAQVGSPTAKAPWDEFFP